jgi:hypothetical protein
MQADYDRRERENEANEQRSEARSNYMREQHPEEYAAQDLLKRQREERKNAECEIRQRASSAADRLEHEDGPVDAREAGGMRADGVFQATPEQQQETQQRVEVEHAEQQKRAAEWDRERQEGPQDSQRETNHRNTEQTERKQKDHEKARRQAWLDAIIEKRRDDREREGGREM